ncbi:MAG TPA: amylo-alpha-1,6-glucosidase [Vicinamibacterales bacterium]|nr:amylo-alpha-1,6-glucosidase [Vicinamibacterales bacterium]
MPDITQTEDQYHILATGAGAPGTSAVLKHGDTFAVFDGLGDIVAAGRGEQGLYHDGTRFLSSYQLRLDRNRPLLLSSRVNADNSMFGADLTNADITEGEMPPLAHDVVHLYRSRFLWNGAVYERLRLVSYETRPVTLRLSYEFGSDFVDIFEVRGTEREQRGTTLPPRVSPHSVELSYRGLDRVIRQTRIEWDVPPATAGERSATWNISLAPHETLTISTTIICTVGNRRTTPPTHDAAWRQLGKRAQRASASYAAVESSNEQFNAWLRRSFADMQMMVSDTSDGPYPYAGVPWFNTPFGRDGIIAAIETLWINPSIAAGVLRYLAATQADDLVPAEDAEPGKILHETRGGEMSALHEVPFGRYYGSVDSTPLFVLLAGLYYERTADRQLVETLWPHIERALGWMDEYGDRDHDGFVEYARLTPTGLAQQGWKDSQDSVFHADGRLADPPIALCEVQAYVYGARRAAAMLARVRGGSSRAEELEQQAERLRQHFEDAFWSDELGLYALALDGDKRPCLVRTSNAGQCLLTGIASARRARRVAETLMSGDLFSGWGIRTVASTEARYNPMSYHNGSIWPHDNALVAAGLARYGLSEFVHPVLSAMFDASLFVDLHRLPELFCGFRRRERGEGPTLYPVACSPQAWASGSVFLLLQASLGLGIDAVHQRVTVSHAQLPSFTKRLTVRRLRIGAHATVDLMFEGRTHDVGVTVLERHGDVEVAITK